MNNFGDMLGPWIVNNITGSSISVEYAPTSATTARRLLTVGSILHLARDGDVIWGSGINGKVPPGHHMFRTLDVRALRGPLSRDYLWRQFGIESPEVFGDPALLLPRFAPELGVEASAKSRAISVVPNLHDAPKYLKHPGYVDPRGATIDVIKKIVASEFVVSSSLHGLIVAEAFKVPVVLLRSDTEPRFKYDDYVQGTARKELPMAASLAEARTMQRRASEDAPHALAEWSDRDLLDAFPRNLFVGQAGE